MGSDDLPWFGKIKEILLLYVEVFKTVGNNHLLCFQIVRTHQFLVFPISKLLEKRTFAAIGDGLLYIAVRSHV